MNTCRCTIDNVKECDYEEIKNLYINEKVRKFLGGPVTSKIYDICFDEIINNTDNSFYWTVRKQDTNEFIALVSLDSHHDWFGKEISYQFMPKFWGDGYAEEVVGAVIDYSFKNLNIDKIVAETQAANIRSSTTIIT
jgi:[ribosomal protein S5]-alanine N-acetyltransferase